MKRYLVMPGLVVSDWDGQLHWLSFSYLCRLYQVRPELCVNYETVPAALKPRFEPEVTKLIVLTPRHKGDYLAHRKRLEESRLVGESR